MAFGKKPEPEKKYKPLAALWESDKYKGSYSGPIKVGSDEFFLRIYRNDKKEPGSKQPDFRADIVTKEGESILEFDK